LAKKARRARSGKRRSNASAGGNLGVQLVAPGDIVPIPRIRRRAVRDRQHLNFTMQQQQGDNWCWAAVGVGVVHFYKPASNLNQCTLANHQLGRDDCCSLPLSDGCDRPYRPLQKLLKRVGHLARRNAGSIKFNKVCAEIKNNRPVAAHIIWDGGGGHFVVLAGFDSNLRKVLIRDPLFADTWMDYDIFRTQYQGEGRWTISYKTKA